MNRKKRLGAYGALFVASALLLSGFSLAPHQQADLVVDEPTHAPPVVVETSPEVREPDRLVPPPAQATNPRPVRTHAESVVREEVRDGEIIDEEGNRYTIHPYTTLITPNDPAGMQWWVTDTGLDHAWDAGQGSTDVVIAIIDSGFDLSHEEFSGRWFQNPGEVGPANAENPSDLNCSDRSIPLNMSCNNIDDDGNGIVDDESGFTTVENPSRLNCSDQGLPLNKSCNLIDDDNNGLADDVTGWDFYSFDRVVESGETNPSGTGVHHGTQVAGIAAATGNNGRGMAGVNWTAKIMPIQALDDNGNGDSLTVGRSIRYAAQMGADVINLSLGTDGYDEYIRQAVADAIDLGSVVVAASGNDGCDCMLYPANFPEVIAVGAKSTSGVRATFSSYGANLDITAPGVSIFAPRWSAVSNASYSPSVSGTSFATPFVSGLLATARSHQPDASWGDLTSLLFEHADKSLVGDGVFASQYGFGYTDAHSFLNRITQPVTIDYQSRLTPLAAGDALESRVVSLCADGVSGANRLYHLIRGVNTRFTTSEYARLQYVESGWTNSFIGYHCSGLPTDIVNTVRSINLLSELYNVRNIKNAL